MLGKVRKMPDSKVFEKIIYNAFQGERNKIEHEPWIVCLPFIVQNYIANLDSIKFEDN